MAAHSPSVFLSTREDSLISRVREPGKAGQKRNGVNISLEEFSVCRNNENTLYQVSELLKYLYYFWI